jgi:hypothetical protein
LSNLLNLLENVQKNMEEKAAKQQRRGSSTIGIYARRAEPGAAFRKLDSTSAVKNST